jgi:hypothetical protein
MQALKMAARVARIDTRGLGIEWRVLASPQVVGLLTGTRTGNPDPS